MQIRLVASAASHLMYEHERQVTDHKETLD